MQHRRCACVAGIACLALTLSICPSAQARPQALGLFEGQGDVGHSLPDGSAAYDAQTGVYTLASAGENTWYHLDHFHFLWRKASGDMALTADIAFPPHVYDHEPNPHRKGILMFRQTLDAGGIYAGVGEHGSGMTALQYRAERGANTQDIELDIDAPKTLRLEKRGDVFTLLLSMRGEPLHQVGAATELHLKAPFYVGLGALSHDGGTIDRVQFSRVTLEPLTPFPAATKFTLYSTLQTIQVEDQFRRAVVIRNSPSMMESPHWAPDGADIYVHADGRVLKIPLSSSDVRSTPQFIDTHAFADCAPNYGVSPDGRWLALSCRAVKGGPHALYLLPAGAGAAGAPRKLTPGAQSSFFHAWSPDSRFVAFTRGSADAADIFTIAAAGGAESRLTRDTVDDGPDYSPDGKFIYFDSARSGTTQIWRMRADGSAPEQITDDDAVNSSPHVSPDGKNVAFLSRPRGAGPDIGEAAIKIMSLGDGLIRRLVRFEGNRGSFSTYAWGNPNHLAFVSYQKLPARSDSAPPLITGVSHIALYASDLGKTARFYVHDLGAVRGEDPENSAGTRYYFAPAQFVEVLPLPTGTASIDRLDHVAFVTADAEALRRYLAAQQAAVPHQVKSSGDGSRWFDVLDPEGNKIEFVEPPVNAPAVPVNALSNHIIHVGFIIHDRAREDGFFRTVLGFKPYWFGGMRDEVPTWISLQVPDGTDWLEYMVVGTPHGRGIAPGMSAADLGVLNHFSLGVANAQTAYALLWNGNRLGGQPNTPKIGRDAKWQLNLLDPDGTRAEIMELHAIGTPCCSPFTAPDPQE